MMTLYLGVYVLHPSGDCCICLFLILTHDGGYVPVWKFGLWEGRCLSFSTFEILKPLSTGDIVSDEVSGTSFFIYAVRECKKQTCRIASGLVISLPITTSILRYF